MSSVKQLLAELVERLRVCRGELEEEIVVRVRERVPDPPGVGSEYAVGLRAAVVAVIDYSFAAIERGGPWTDPLPLPLAALTQARLAASIGVPFETVLRRYLVGAMVLRQYVLAHAGHGDGSIERWRAVCAQALNALDSLLDRLVVELEGAYEQEVQIATRSRGQRHAALVEKVLAGEPVDATQLGYDLQGVHLGLIATGPNAEVLVRQVGALLEQPLLTVTRDEETVWAWLGGRYEPSIAAVERAERKARIGDATLLALGEPAAGVVGFRRTHGEARDALFVGRRDGTVGVLRYRDVALVAHALRDEQFAKSLVERYLVPLEGREELHDTLRAYLDAGRNAMSAAAALKVDRGTVSRRVKEIERRLGRSVSACHMEIELALRLRGLSGTASEHHGHLDQHANDS
jgi:hypothetical protein